MARENKKASAVIKAIDAYRVEADTARKHRLELNKRNMAAYMGEQDFSHKSEGQSQEFLPKTSMAVEQFSAFVKRALVQFGDWFSVKANQGDLRPEEIVNLLQVFFGRLPKGDDWTTLPLVVSEGVKSGLLGSLMVFKVHGQYVKERQYRAVGDELKSVEGEVWRLRVDPVRQEDYYPDPTGRNLYEIHRVERELFDIVAQSEGDNALYDKAEVRKLKTEMERPVEEKRRASHRGQREEQKPGFRKKVVLDEFWGTILDEDGKVLHRNVVATVANEKFLIRPPEPNPFWHQESPFVKAPLIRVPDSVWHKAMFDDAVPLNEAMNELFNLMLDGGIASVWGIKQVRSDWLEDPGQVSNGIPQGSTLLVNDQMPVGAKVLEQLSEGQVPNDAMAMYGLLDQLFNSAAKTNDLKLGNLPSKEVRATEVIEASQSQSVTVDDIAGDIEQQALASLIRKAWLTILQNIESVPGDDVRAAIGDRAALALIRKSPAQRFATYGSAAEFRVSGLSATLAKVRDYQKLASLMQIAQANPMLAQALFKKYSPDAILRHMMKLLNFDPTDMERTAEELERLADDMAGMQQFAQVLNGPASVNGPGTGGGGIPAEVNQVSNPLTGLGQD